jgi:RNA polymerase sigma factor (sigma-70 family)
VSPWISHRFLRAQSDERLLAAARQGHARAFEILVERHRRGLLACARRVLGTERQEDALQQGLLNAWVALQNGNHVRNPRAWLFRVVHNTAVDILRSTRSEQAALTDFLPAKTAVEADIELNETLRATLTGVAALPAVQREALLLTALEGHSHERVGSALGVSADAVRGLVYRARSSLRAAASVLVPPQLVGWAAAAHRRWVPLRPAGGGAGGSQALLERGAAVISAGALVAGVATASVQMRRHGHHPGSRSARIAGQVERTRAGGLRGAGEDRLDSSAASAALATGAGSREQAALVASGTSTLPATKRAGGHAGGSRSPTRGAAPQDGGAGQRKSSGTEGGGSETGSDGTDHGEGGHGITGGDGGPGTSDMSRGSGSRDEPGGPGSGSSPNGGSSPHGEADDSAGGSPTDGVPGGGGGSPGGSEPGGPIGASDAGSTGPNDGGVSGSGSHAGGSSGSQPSGSAPSVSPDGARDGRQAPGAPATSE